MIVRVYIIKNSFGLYNLLDRRGKIIKANYSQQYLKDYIKKQTKFVTKLVHKQ